VEINLTSDLRLPR